MERKLTREVKIGSLKMGGTNPIVIQSMCNTDTRDVEVTVAQILKPGLQRIRKVLNPVPHLSLYKTLFILTGLVYNLHIMPDFRRKQWDYFQIKKLRQMDFHLL